jgi:DNA-binding transcriptional regulator YdaS (Cro superfamily)
MKLSEYLSQERGRAAAMAKALGTHAPNVTDWAKGKRPVPIAYGAQIEQLTAGLVTRQDLFPEDWLRIWPELNKRRRRTDTNS